MPLPAASISKPAMPELANLALPATLPLSHCSAVNSPDAAVKPLPNGYASDDVAGEARVLKRSRGSVERVRKTANDKRLLEDRLKDPLSFPFLHSAPKMVECLVCHHGVCPGEEIVCSVRECGTRYHPDCAKEAIGGSSLKKFKCPQHVCFVCKQKLHLRCVRCPMAFHIKCAPWPDEVIVLKDHPGKAVCWRHPSDWRLDRKPDTSTSDTTSDLPGVFCCLPLPFTDEEFKTDFNWKDMDSKMEPPPYVHIRRNIYLVKKKRSVVDDDAGCTSCGPTCHEDCVCRVQCISCSKACGCSANCSNRPFRKEKKIEIVKTELCGWGVEAAEEIDKGGFIIEYVGEVIDDALCEKRLWDMKYQDVHNFYMCEIRKDFTIDATFKGNTSRFLNHSCNPNCILEKWQVDGETRVGVFAARSIEVGEPLTYDYRFVQFGQEVKCHCGAPNCQGFLGTKKKIGKVLRDCVSVTFFLCWGSKRKRTSKPGKCRQIEKPTINGHLGSV